MFVFVLLVAAYIDGNVYNVYTDWPGDVEEDQAL